VFTLLYNDSGKPHRHVLAQGRRADSQSFRVFAELDDRVVRVHGESRSLAPGMGGRAAIIVGCRSLVSYAFEPIRQMRENLASAR